MDYISHLLSLSSAADVAINDTWLYMTSQLWGKHVKSDIYLIG